MGQGLIGAAFTYFYFSDIVFGPLSPTNKILRMPTIIETGKNLSFGLYMDDHLSLAKTFGNMFQFLHETYCFCNVFGPIYLTEKKTFTFNNKLDILGFEGTSKGLKPITKH